jgi:hypothetical protein
MYFLRLSQFLLFIIKKSSNFVKNFQFPRLYINIYVLVRTCILYTYVVYTYVSVKVSLCMCSCAIWVCDCPRMPNIECFCYYSWAIRSRLNWFFAVAAHNVRVRIRFWTLRTHSYVPNISYLQYEYSLFCTTRVKNCMYCTEIVRVIERGSTIHQPARRVPRQSAIRHASSARWAGR